MTDDIVEVGNPIQSATLGKFAEAFAKAQSELQKASKDSTNPHFRSKFADINSVIDACREALNKNGISFIQRNLPLPEGKHGVVLQTVLVHSSGEWIADGGLFVPASKADAQGFGSAQTYARRYGLVAMVGIAQEDDDGNKAVASQRTAAKAATIKPPVKG